ncbi:ABC transporter substrate-binding protein [Schaalia sp. Marseille-Q2122]|uniref:ABC transporter substrate-binding protein n=1 Tax=Schaalia sp. Marseille-Q2122 TaxID=2736604 RepID=UPI0020CA8205|nr:ABC transporter substrate-binding protein [Schaalia sp. Marseille-Q2122]
MGLFSRQHDSDAAHLHDPQAGTEHMRASGSGASRARTRFAVPRASRKGMGILATAAALVLGACAASDPFGEAGADTAAPMGAIVVGSQDYYSNEIIAEIYAQALEAEGFTVDRQLRIGPRDVYLPEIEAGHIDVFPEYSGNLLQYWKPETQARQADEVITELQAAAPAGLRVLPAAQASDQDSYTVTRAFADKWGLKSISDLSKVTDPLLLGANSEAQERPYGPAGLAATYEVDISFTPIEDSGGALTVKALLDGDIQLANIYTADPAIATHNLVTLEDPKGLFLASNVVPLVSERLSEEAVTTLNAVNAQLTTDDLVTLNSRSVNEGLPAGVLAAQWLEQHR